MRSRRTRRPALGLGGDPRLFLRRQGAEELGVLMPIVILQGVTECRPAGDEHAEAALRADASMPKSHAASVA